MVIPGLGLQAECAIEDSNEDTLSLRPIAAAPLSKKTLASAPNPEDCFEAPDIEMNKFE